MAACRQPSRTRLLIVGRGQGMVSHEDIDNRLEKDEGRLSDIDSKLSEIAELLKPLPEMQKDIAATKELVEAWATVKNAGRFIKWTGTIAGAIVAIWLLLKAGVKALVL